MAETKHLIPGLFWRLLGFKGELYLTVETDIFLGVFTNPYNDKINE